MSSGAHDYQHDGFFARNRAEEMPCPDLELKVLWSTEDVTAAVNAAIDPHALPQTQNAQRKAALAKLEQEATQRSGLKTEAGSCQALARLAISCRPSGTKQKPSQWNYYVW